MVWSQYHQIMELLQHKSFYMIISRAVQDFIFILHQPANTILGLKSWKCFFKSCPVICGPDNCQEQMRQWDGGRLVGLLPYRANIAELMLIISPVTSSHSSHSRQYKYSQQSGPGFINYYTADQRCKPFPNPISISTRWLLPYPLLRLIEISVMCVRKQVFMKHLK